MVLLLVFVFWCPAALLLALSWWLLLVAPVCGACLLAVACEWGGRQRCFPWWDASPWQVVTVEELCPVSVVLPWVPGLRHC